MSNRKNRNEQIPVDEKKEPGVAGQSPAAPGKSPGRLMFVVWGIPLILFIIIAVIKQCEW